MRRQALDLATEINELPFEDVYELRAEVRERLGRGKDLGYTSLRLRPLLNRVLDVIDVSWLSPSQVRELEHALFAFPASPARYRPAA